MNICTHKTTSMRPLKTEAPCHLLDKLSASDLRPLASLETAENGPPNWYGSISSACYYTSPTGVAHEPARLVALIGSVSLNLTQT